MKFLLINAAGKERLTKKKKRITRLKKIVLAERDGRQLDTLSTLQVRLCARRICCVAVRDCRVLPCSSVRQGHPQC